MQWKRRGKDDRQTQMPTQPDHKAINDERIRNHKAIDLVLENALHKATITALVRMVDELRQPYNNSKRHDLYLMATNKLNNMEDRGLIRWDWTSLDGTYHRAAHRQIFLATVLRT